MIGVTCKYGIPRKIRSIVKCCPQIPSEMSHSEASLLQKVSAVMTP